METRHANNPALQIHAACRPGAAILNCAGEIDLGSADLLEEAIASWVEAGVPELEVDLSQITYLDSSAVPAFLDAHRRMDRAGRTLRVRVNPRSGRLFRLLRLDRVLNLENETGARVPGSGSVIGSC